MRRTLFGDLHETFRGVLREFLTREVVPLYPAWVREGQVPKEVFAALGSIGVMGINMPEEFGGGGQDDYLFNVVIQEETARAGVTIGSLRTHLDIVLPYFRAYADADQRRRWFPGISSGALLTAIAMTEPDSGSDLAGIRTTAVRDGDTYLLSGAKTFITGGLLADLVIVVARTARDPDDRRHGLTLLVVEDGVPGFTKGRKLAKLGLHAQDTLELTFENVRVPVASRLGEEGLAFSYLGHNLAQERLAIAVGAVATAREALARTIEYVRARTVFGQPLSGFQNTKFELAAVATEIEAAQSMLDTALVHFVNGELAATDAAMVKLFCTEAQGRCMDRCLQLHGGYGFITEFPIAGMYADARVTRIYGGTSEVMKTIISKSLGL
jgi:acyl-CoA dehydrogenase